MGSEMRTHLVWLRNDLRINDNLALHAACRDAEAQVVALYIATPQQWRQHDMAPRQAAFIYDSLLELQQALADRGIVLHTHECDDFAASLDYLAEFCQRQQVDALFYNYQYELNERRRDAEAERRLDKAGVVCQGFDDSVLLAPGSVQTGDGKMYKVYTPFSKAFVRRLQQAMPECVTAPKTRSGGAVKVEKQPARFSYPMETFDRERFTPGETAALKRLRQFAQQPVLDYHAERDTPSVDGTSRLSVYLTTGVLSPRQCLHRVLREHPDALTNANLFCWLNELIWREFYRHLMVAYPALCRHQPFVDWTRHVGWQRNEAHFDAWKAAKPAIPSWMRRCARCRRWAGCTTGCA